MTKQNIQPSVKQNKNMTDVRLEDNSKLEDRKL